MHRTASLFVVLALFACSRASAPPPPPSEPAQPLPSAESAKATPGPAASADGTWMTPKDCAGVDAADARARATCDAKEEFRSFVAARQACTSPAECTIVTGSCPFGCFVPVAKSSEVAVVSKLGELGDRLDKAGHRCVYRCMSPPEATCLEGRCAAKSAQ